MRCTTRRKVCLPAGQREPSRVLAYCRVSSAAQKPDLINQRRVLLE